ncbi:Aspergillopepsin-2 [Madurella mycetomatis]|uniref:Aspergillopepsin-2 n=1 Tax=Madurella mycetomatis TaxID=100816 RepID=A0A175WC13_9PEZI|nr:Aspergillopepsin-2 [Madurella mycetomatis]
MALLRLATAAESIQGGALYTVPSDSSDTITSISGTFRVPDASIPLTGPTSGHQGIYGFSIWIGIGGYQGYGSASACPATSSALRAGIDVYYNGYSDRPMAPFAWYQFGIAGENGAFAYAGFNLEAGDLIRITVNAEDGNITTIVENYGKVDSTAGRTPLQREPPTYGIQGYVASTLCRTEAAWIVQDHMTETEPAEPVVMANFTDITFTEMNLRTSSGVSGVATVAEPVNINLPEQGGQLTDCSAVDGSEFRCRRVVAGPSP